jgi:type I restriction enzyme M protein
VDDIIACASAIDTNEASISVPVTEVMANDSQLQPSRYVLPAPDRKIQELLARSKVVALGDLVTTVRPMPTAAAGEDLVTVWEIGASDIPSYSFISTPGREVKIDAQAAVKSEHQFLRPLDIILIVKGSTGKVGIVPKDVPPPGPGGWVAGQSAIVLRLNPKSPVDARALAIQLRSDIGRTLLRSIESGATIPLIQLKELMSLRVLVPDKVTSAKAIKALEREAQLQEEIARLREEQSNAARDLWAV